MADNARRNDMNAPFDKEARARDGKKAMSEYEAEGIAIRARTERLKALRLAKEAAEPPVVKAVKAPAKGAAKGASKTGASKTGAGKAAAPKKKAAKPKKDKSTLSAWLDGEATDGRRS